MNFILPATTLFLCIISGVVYWRDLMEHPIAIADDGQESQIPRSALIFAVIMICVTIVAAVMLGISAKESATIMAQIKKMALLSVMWPIAYIDYKTYRIPNSFIILGLVYRVVIIAAELLFVSDQLGMQLLSEVIAAAALLLAAGLCALCMRNSIGFGDMKLFVVMGLLLGLNTIWSAIFMSLIVSFVIAVFLLLTKKKTRKDAIPFGPALVIGTYLAICLS